MCRDTDNGRPVQRNGLDVHVFVLSRLKTHLKGVVRQTNTDLNRPPRQTFVRNAQTSCKIVDNIVCALQRHRRDYGAGRSTGTFETLFVRQHTAILLFNSIIIVRTRRMPVIEIEPLAFRSANEIKKKI